MSTSGHGPVSGVEQPLNNLLGSRQDVGNVVAAVSSQRAWDSTFADFQVRDMHDVVEVVSWLAYRLPAGSPIRDRLPVALAAARTRFLDRPVTLEILQYTDRVSDMYQPDPALQVMYTFHDKAIDESCEQRAPIPLPTSLDRAEADAVEDRPGRARRD
jgi:hypothetical protein